MNQKVTGKLREGIWKIDRYGSYGMNGWNEETSMNSRIYLILKNLILIVMKNDTVIEYITLGNNVRMVLKNDSLGIAITEDEKKIRKCRLRFANLHTFSSSLIAKSCTELLKKYVRVEDISPKAVFANVPTAEGNNLSVFLTEHVKQLMKKSLTEFYSGDKDFSSTYPLEDMIEVCILDKDFPAFVAEVNEVLLKKIEKK